MAAPAVAHGMTPEAYFAWVAEQDEKHEFYDGEVFAMAGGSDRHALATVNATVALAGAFRPRGCSVYSSDMRVQLSESRRYIYPDVSAVCGAPEFLDAGRLTLLNPTLVVEVLSPSTGDFDLGTKAMWYRALPSLQALVLVSQDAPAVTVHAREGGHWITTDVSGLDATIDVLGERVALADLFFEIEF